MSEIKDGCQFSRSQTQRKISLARLKKAKSDYKKQYDVDSDLFSLVSDWYHFAILELTYLKNFQSDPGWIGKTLGITTVSAEAALIRLLKFRLIKLENGRLVATENYSLVTTEYSSESIRKFHSQIINKALLAVESQSKDERCLRSSMVSIRKNKINEAFAAIERFHQEFCEVIGEGDQFNFEKDSVYAISTQFFRLTTRVRRVSS